MLIHFESPIETLDHVSIFIIRPTFPSYEYYARDIVSAMQFLTLNEHRLFTSDIYIRSVPFHKIFDIHPEFYIDNVLFSPWWQL